MLVSELIKELSSHYQSGDVRIHDLSPCSHPGEKELKLVKYDDNSGDTTLLIGPKGGGE